MKISKKILLGALLTSSLASALTLATVNGVKITGNDVDSALMNATQGRFNQVPMDKQAELRKQMLEQLIAKELVYEDAQKTGVLKSQDFTTEYKKVQDRIKRELAIQVWQKQLLDQVKVSTADMKKYYDENKDEFNQKESVRARHILVKTEDEAKAIIADLKGLSGDALKSKFIELAKAKSTGPSGPKGGDLGYFTEGQMVPAFNDKVFSMAVGTATTEPVKTQFGYHVIYLEDKQAKTTRSFSEVKAFIEQRLKMEEFKTVMEKKMKALKDKSKIVINETK